MKRRRAQAAMRLYNTRTRQIESFKPLNSEQVTIYTCGPTVYDRLHVGNWSAYIRWDILVRVLMAEGRQVKRVINITDVGHLTSDADEGEDKLEQGARREGKTAWDIAKLYTGDFLAGMKRLNLIEPTVYAKATDHIPEQIALIQRLEELGFTYTTSDGLYFNTAKFPAYADFAKLELADQKAGARVNINPEKKSPVDFALWKFSPGGQKRDMEWDSPWGKGFPGWHIECSAMAMKYLGETIDIHTGGIDHIPVHHTNEIAQSEAATGRQFANFWLHNNFMLVDEAKMSKSAQSGITLDDVEARGFSLDDFKMLVLQSHYRSESHFSWENLAAAKTRLQRYRNFAVRRFQNVSSGSSSLDPNRLAKPGQVILPALANDLDTPAALAAIEDYMEKVSSENLSQETFLLADYLQFIDSVFGFRLMAEPDITADQKALIAERESARRQSNWPKSDELRSELAKQGLEINDTNNGSIWLRV